MNSLVEQQFPVLTQTLALRQLMLDLLTDDDLGFSPPHNPALGALCLELGEYDQMYTESFKTFTMPWGRKHDDPAVANSVAGLKAWFAANEDALKAALQALPEEALYGQMVERGHGSWPVMVQFHVYREGLLIFYGKMSVYLKALQKPLPEQWQQWIG